MSSSDAVIDIGTVKVKSLVAHLDSNGALIEDYSSATLTCFGCEIDTNKGNIKDTYLKVTINELLRLKKILKDKKVRSYKIVSTHALRRAKNKETVLNTIKKLTGFLVEEISQEEEANLFFKAVMTSFPPKNNGDYALVDVGGGSVQILIGSPTKLKHTYLLSTGSEFLHTKFTKDPSNPLSFTTEQDLERIKDYILKQLIPVQKHKGIPLIYGSSNIINLMQFLGIPLENFKNSPEHPYKTYSRYLENFMNKVLPLSYKEREAKYPFMRGYMWGIDKAFLNISLITNHFSSPFVIPTNANIAKGILYSLIK